MAARSFRADKADDAIGAMRTFRVDLAEGLGKIRLLGDGTVAIPARIARAGVLEYTTDGKTTSEYRDPAEVFSQESLDSFKGVTVTLDHPDGGVDPSNWASLSTGHIGDDVRRDGQYVAATVYVKRQDGIEAIKKGDAVECSGGYFCTTVEESGVSFDGVPYTHRQTMIRGNHVALGPKDWGRSGNNVRMYLDAREPSKQPKKDTSTMDEATKKAFHDLLAQLGKLVTGEGTAPPAAAAAAEADTKKADETPAPKEGEEQQKADAARAAAKADAARDAQQAATQDARISQLVQDSVAIHTRAALMGVKDCAGKSNLTVMCEAIKLARPTCDSAAMAAKGEAYVRAYFDSMHDEASAKPAEIISDAADLDRVFGKIVSTTPPERGDAADESPAAERAKMLARQEARNAAPC